MKKLICIFGLAGLLVSCGNNPPIITPIIGVRQPTATPDVTKPVDDVGKEAGQVDSTSQTLRSKIDSLKDTVKNSQNALDKANAKVEILQKQGSATLGDLNEVWSLVQDVKSRNASLEVSVEDAKTSMDIQRQAIAKLNASIVEARSAAAEKDAEVGALRDSVMEANHRLQQASTDQSKLMQQVAKGQSELAATQEKLSNALVYKWWFIGILVLVILSALAKFLIPILVKSATL